MHHPDSLYSLHVPLVWAPLCWDPAWEQPYSLDFVFRKCFQPATAPRHCNALATGRPLSSCQRLCSESSKTSPDTKLMATQSLLSGRKAAVVLCLPAILDLHIFQPCILIYPGCTTWMLIHVFCGYRSRLWSLAISNDLAHVFDTTLDLFLFLVTCFFSPSSRSSMRLADLTCNVC